MRNKYNIFLVKIIFNEMVYYAQVRRREKRMKAYTKNFMYRRKMRLLFEGWRGVSHKWFKERINAESVQYLSTKREQMLAAWDQEVEALKLYMAQLQEKIRIEVMAREDLTKTYESSLNRGVVMLNEETRSLAENPLVREISLIVAQELITKSKMDPQIAQLL